MHKHVRIDQVKEDVVAKFEYENEEQGYHYYTAVRQNNQYYYRVAFYCLKEYWSEHESNFADWATTIKLEQK